MKKQIDYGSYASYKETVKGLTENLKSLLGLSEEIALVNTGIYSGNIGENCRGAF